MRGFWDMLENWLRSWSSKPDSVVKPAKTPLVAARIGSSEPTKGGSMETTFANLVEFFEAEGLKHEAHPEDGIVIAGFRAQNLSICIYFMLHADEGLLQLFAPLPGKIPQGCRAAIAEAITRANYGAKMGKFELDYSSGELRFQIANAFTAEGLDAEIIRRLIGTAVHTVDRYFPAVMSIAYGNELPDDAIRHVEQTVG